MDEPLGAPYINIWWRCLSNDSIHCANIQDIKTTQSYNSELNQRIGKNYTDINLNEFLN